MKEELTGQQVQEILQAAQGAQQAAQEAKQIAQGVQQSAQELKQAVQGSTQEKSNVTDAVTQNKQEEILGGEGIRAATISGVRLWNFNEKLIAAKELEYDLALKAAQLKDKEIEIARKQHDLAHAQKMDLQNISTKQFLDSINVTNAQNGQNFDFGVKMDYAKFNNATSEPIAPNTQDAGNTPDE